MPQQQHISVCHPLSCMLDIRGGGVGQVAHHRGNNVPVGVGFLLLSGNGAFLVEHLHQGLIRGKLTHFCVPVPVQPGIAHVEKMQQIVFVYADAAEGCLHVPGLTVAGAVLGVLLAVWYDRRVKARGGLSFTIVRVF